MKADILASKHAEEHHNTVKYFEGLVGDYKVKLSRF